jgi:hypothetical protein
MLSLPILLNHDKSVVLSQEVASASIVAGVVVVQINLKECQEWINQQSTQSPRSLV